MNTTRSVMPPVLLIETLAVDHDCSLNADQGKY